MNKKKNHISARQAAEKAVIRDEQNRRIRYAATNPVQMCIRDRHTTLCGLDMEEVSASRARYGSNKATHEKKKSLLRRLADAFINPFTAILFFLALVSTMTDMVFPYFSLFGSAPEDFDCLTDVYKRQIRNFLYNVCGATGDWTMKNYAQTAIEQIRAKVGDGKVLLALSGGVDSSVVASLISKAVGRQLTCIFVDHGLMRKNEGDEIEAVFGDGSINFIRINAEDRFLARLAGVTDPERKRKIIGEEFIRIFEEEGRQTAYIVVALDDSGIAHAGLDYVRIDGALCQICLLYTSAKNRRWSKTSTPCRDSEAWMFFVLTKPAP